VIRKKSPTPIQIDLLLKGDKRLAENVKLEVCALAERYGLEIPSVRVLNRPAVRPKRAKSTPPARRVSNTRGKRSV
jgi:hypothetical protein